MFIAIGAIGCTTVAWAMTLAIGLSTPKAKQSGTIQTKNSRAFGFNLPYSNS
tara:strand:+ start:104 stop:259 length:156 start_codon:yes stop_codon:yes gene_type:complete